MGLGVGSACLAAALLPTRALKVDLFAAPPELVEAAREIDRGTELLFMLRSSGQQGVAGGPALWLESSVLTVSAPRYREFDERRGDLAAVLPAPIALTVDHLLLLSRTVGRSPSWLHGEIVSGEPWSPWSRRGWSRRWSSCLARALEWASRYRDRSRSLGPVGKARENR